MATTITDSAGLQNMKLDLTEDYILGANIDCSDIANFEPIGGWNAAAAFTGTFDGKGFQILNLVVNRAADDYIGLFGEIDAATIKNVIVTATLTGDDYVGIIGKSTGSTVELVGAIVTIVGDTYVGGLIGGAYTTTATSCSSSGSINAYQMVGGLIGLINGDSIEDCHSSITVSASGSGPHDVGGLIGTGYLASGAISKCYSTGNVTATRTGTSAVLWVGGFLGRGGAASGISRCYSTGDVSIINDSANVNGSVGDIGGFIGNGYYDVTDCYTTGDVSVSKALGQPNWASSGDIGGFIGEYDYVVAATDSVMQACFCASVITIADVTAEGSTGGFCGDSTSSGGTIDANCFWDITISGEVASDGGTSKTTAQMQDIETFSAAGWAVSRIWSLLETCNNGYPCLISVNPCCPPTLLPPLDPTIAPKKVSLELIRNLEIMNNGRFFIARGGDATYESRFHRT